MSSDTRDLERLVSLRRDAERIVRDLFHADPSAEQSEVRLTADVMSEAARFVIEVELAGVSRDDLQVFALGDTIVVEGWKRERRADLGGVAAYDRVERSYGHFRRVFDLPGPGDLSRTAATLRGGVLSIVVPRIEDRRNVPRPIPIEANP